MHKSWTEVTARDREEWQASYERKVRASKAECAEYLLLSDGEKLIEIDHFFALAYDKGCAQRIDSCGSNPERAPCLRSDKACDLFVARTLRLLLNEVRVLREDVKKRRDQTNPPHQSQLEFTLLEEVRSLRQGIGQSSFSLLNEVRVLREDVEKRRDQTEPPHPSIIESSLLEEVRNLRQDIGQSSLLKELKELRQGLIPLQRANHFMYVSYACLGVLVLLLFK